MPEVTITVDGVTITVPAGINVVDAARMANIAIPVFCYHPRLKPVGMCRMCLVQIGTPRLDPATRRPLLDDAGKPVIAMMPKLQTACTTIVSEGMVVNTQSAEVKFAQRGILEFLLTSHPLDCPVCDKGGECPLQNLTMEWGPASSRFDYNDKIHFEKPIPLGDLIYLDRERCILCGRCVRFQDELADDPVLGFDHRGRNWMIISKSDPPFDSKFSGNTTDICPVGALTSSDFRFRARVWELTSVPAICTLCPVGCNMSLDMRHDRLMRVMPRENAAVNDIWLCDKGRYGHRFFEHPDRLTTPLVRRGAELVEASWDEALELVVTRLLEVQRSRGGQAIAGIAAPRLSNEDLYLFQKLFREVLESNNLDHQIGAPGEPPCDDMGALLAPGREANLMELGNDAAVMVLGADPEEEAPLYVLRLRSAVQRGAHLIVANLRPTKLERSATLAARYHPGGELAFLHGLLREIITLTEGKRLKIKTTGFDQLKQVLRDLTPEHIAERSGVAVETIAAIARTLVEAERLIIIYGAEARSAGLAVIEALGALLALSGKVGQAQSGVIALLPGGNSRGALDLGVRPDARPGYAPLVRPGLCARDVWPAIRDGRVRAVWIAGLDPAASLPVAQQALREAEFVVVQDLFLTETAKLAHVVLPTASVAERDGTYTNAERRVQRSRQARSPVGQSRPDWQIVADVARAMIARAAERAVRDGKAQGAAEPWDYLTTADVTAEIAERAPGYAGVTYAALDATGKPGAWGRQVNEAIFYDGTNYENTEGIGIKLPPVFEVGKSVLSLAPRPAPSHADDRPLLLLAQPLAYGGDPLLRGSKLAARIPTPYIAVSAADAAKRNIHTGDLVRLDSAAGSITLPAHVVPDLPPGVVLAPADLPGASLAAVQTGPRTRVSLVKLVTG